MAKRPILIDVDGVLADFIGGCLKYINNRDGTNFKNEDIDKDLQKYPFWGDDCEAFVKSPGFCMSLDPIKEGFKIVDKLRSLNETIMFVTSPFEKAPTWCHDRQMWLEKYFGATRNDVIFCRNKQFVDGKMLVDDYDKNIYRWETYDPYNRRGLLFNQPWNKVANYDYQFRRISSLEEFLEYYSNFISDPSRF